MGKRVFILVEGIADLVFIKDFIIFHHNYCSLGNGKIDSKTKEITLGNGNNEVKIFCIGGKDLDKDNKQILLQKYNKFNANDLLVIFDADDNLNEARENIKSFINFQNIEEKQIFLFPNNKDNGDLESFLEEIVVEIEVLNCWKSFENCILNTNKGFTIPARKSKIHTYLEVLSPNNKEGKKSCKEVNRDYKDTEKWNIGDLSIKCVNGLKSFLDNYI